MFEKGLCVALFIALPLLGQTHTALQERINRAPLTSTAREAVTTALAHKEFERLEAVLIQAAQTAAPKERAAAICALLAALEFANARTRQAVQGFRQADALSPLDDGDRFTLSMALIDLGDVTDARAELSRLNDARPNQAIYWYWLGRLDYDQRLYDTAIQKFKRVVDLEPGAARGYDNLGLTYDMLGRTEEALSAFTKATALNRKLPAPSPWPPDNLGYFLFRQQQIEEAETSLREALRYQPKFALAHYHLARVLESKSRNDEAIAEYKAAAALDGKFALPLYSLGVLYRRRGQQTDSETALAEYRRRRALSGDSQ